jgi:hypothetical protein
MITLVFSLVLSALISDVVGSHHGHDVHPDRRLDVESTSVEVPHSVRFYEVPEPRRMNRMRLIPRTNPETNPLATGPPPAVHTDTRTPEHEVVHFDARADHVADVSHAPAQAVGSPVLVNTPSPMTPPSTPPERVSPSSPVEDTPTPDLGIHEDELQTPALLVIQTLPLQVVDGTAGEVSPVDEADQDELQTPLALNLRALPPLTLEQPQSRDETRSLLLEDIPPDDSASVLEGNLPEDADNISELSLQSGTELSIISATDAQIIRSKAELLRKQAWAEDARARSLKAQLEQAISQNRIKDAFLLRREIETVETRARRLHGRAARRHFGGMSSIIVLTFVSHCESSQFVQQCQ